MILILSLILAGCSPATATTMSYAAATATTKDVTNTTAAMTTASATAGQTTVASFPISVKDGLGKDIVIKSAPKAIICTNIWSAEILFELIDISRIKGLSAWNDKPAMTVTAEKAKAVKARISTQQPEGIVSLMPDLVIIDSFSDPDGSLTKTLTEAGAVVLSMKSPTDFIMIADAIRTIAKTVGASDRGEKLVAEMNQTLDKVSTAVKGVAEKDRLKTLFFEAYYDQSGTNAGMLAAYGEGSTFASIAKAAGLINVCNAPNYSAISKEKIIAEWLPDILVVPAIIYDAKYEPQPDTAKTLINAVLNDSMLKSLPAVKNKQVIAITEAYRGSTSQYMAKAVEELAKVAYPKLF